MKKIEPAQKISMKEKLLETVQFFEDMEIRALKLNESMEIRVEQILADQKMEELVREEEMEKEKQERRKEKQKRKREKRAKNQHRGAGKPEMGPKEEKKEERERNQPASTKKEEKPEGLPLSGTRSDAPSSPMVLVHVQVADKRMTHNEHYVAPDVARPQVQQDAYVAYNRQMEEMGTDSKELVSRRQKKNMKKVNKKAQTKTDITGMFDFTHADCEHVPNIKAHNKKVVEERKTRCNKQKHQKTPRMAKQEFPSLGVTHTNIPVNKDDQNVWHIRQENLKEIAEKFAASERMPKIEDDLSDNFDMKEQSFDLSEDEFNDRYNSDIYNSASDEEQDVHSVSECNSEEKIMNISPKNKTHNTNILNTKHEKPIAKKEIGSNIFMPSIHDSFTFGTLEDLVQSQNIIHKIPESASSPEQAMLHDEDKKDVCQTSTTHSSNGEYSSDSEACTSQSGVSMDSNTNSQDIQNIYKVTSQELIGGTSESMIENGSHAKHIFQGNSEKQNLNQNVNASKDDQKRDTEEITITPTEEKKQLLPRADMDPLSTPSAKKPLLPDPAVVLYRNVRWSSKSVRWQPLLSKLVCLPSQERHRVGNINICLIHKEFCLSNK